MLEPCDAEVTRDTSEFCHFKFGFGLPTLTGNPLLYKIENMNVHGHHKIKNKLNPMQSVVEEALIKPLIYAQL